VAEVPEPPARNRRDRVGNLAHAGTFVGSGAGSCCSCSGISCGAGTGSSSGSMTYSRNGFPMTNFAASGRGAVILAGRNGIGGQPIFALPSPHRPRFRADLGTLGLTRLPGGHRVRTLTPLLMLKLPLRKC